MALALLINIHGFQYDGDDGKGSLASLISREISVIVPSQSSRNSLWVVCIIEIGILGECIATFFDLFRTFYGAFSIATLETMI